MVADKSSANCRLADETDEQAATDNKDSKMSTCFAYAMHSLMPISVFILVFQEREKALILLAFDQF
jgi:hypothetical protein